MGSWQSGCSRYPLQCDQVQDERKIIESKCDGDDNNDNIITMEFIIYLNYYTIYTSSFAEYFDGLITNWQCIPYEFYNISNFEDNWQYFAENKYSKHCKLLIESTQLKSDKVYCLIHQLFNGRILYDPNNNNNKHKVIHFTNKVLTIRDGVENVDFEYKTNKMTKCKYYYHGKYDKMYLNILSDDRLSFEFGIILHETALNVYWKYKENISSSIKASDGRKQEIINGVIKRLKDDDRAIFIPKIFKQQQTNSKKAKGIVNSHINRCNFEQYTDDDMALLIDQINENPSNISEYLEGLQHRPISPLSMLRKALGNKHRFNKIKKDIKDGRNDLHLIMNYQRAHDAQPRDKYTRICHNWKTQKWCPYQNECRFVHDLKTIRIVFRNLIPAIRIILNCDINGRSKKNAKIHETTLQQILKDNGITNYITECEINECMEKTPDIYFNEIKHKINIDDKSQEIDWMDSKGFYLGVIRNIYTDFKRKKYKQILGNGIWVMSLPYVIPPIGISLHELTGGHVWTQNELKQNLKHNKNVISSLPATSSNVIYTALPPCPPPALSSRSRPNIANIVGHPWYVYMADVRQSETVDQIEFDDERTRKFLLNNNRWHKMKRYYFGYRSSPFMKKKSNKRKQNKMKYSAIKLILINHQY